MPKGGGGPGPPVTPPSTPLVKPSSKSRRRKRKGIKTKRSQTGISTRQLALDAIDRALLGNPRNRKALREIGIAIDPKKQGEPYDPYDDLTNGWATGSMEMPGGSSVYQRKRIDGPAVSNVGQSPEGEQVEPGNPGYDLPVNTDPQPFDPPQEQMQMDPNWKWNTGPDFDWSSADDYKQQQTNEEAQGDSNFNVSNTQMGQGKAVGSVTDLGKGHSSSKSKDSIDSKDQIRKIKGDQKKPKKTKVKGKKVKGKSIKGSKKKSFKKQSTTTKPRIKDEVYTPFHLGINNIQKALKLRTIDKNDILENRG